MIRTSSPLILEWLRLDEIVQISSEAAEKAKCLASNAPKPPLNIRLARYSDIEPDTILWTHRGESETDLDEWYWVIVNENYGPNPNWCPGVEGVQYLGDDGCVYTFQEGENRVYVEEFA